MCHDQFKQQHLIFYFVICPGMIKKKSITLKRFMYREIFFWLSSPLQLGVVLILFFFIKYLFVLAFKPGSMRSWHKLTTSCTVCSKLASASHGPWFGSQNKTNNISKGYSAEINIPHFIYLFFLPNRNRQPTSTVFVSYPLTTKAKEFYLRDLFFFKKTLCF